MPIYLNGRRYIGGYMNGHRINGYMNGQKLFSYADPNNPNTWPGSLYNASGGCIYYTSAQNNLHFNYYTAPSSVNGKLQVFDSGNDQGFNNNDVIMKVNQCYITPTSTWYKGSILDCSDSWQRKLYGADYEIDNSIKDPQKCNQYHPDLKNLTNIWITNVNSSKITKSNKIN